MFGSLIRRKQNRARPNGEDGTFEFDDLFADHRRAAAVRAARRRARLRRRCASPSWTGRPASS